MTASRELRRSLDRVARGSGHRCTWRPVRWRYRRCHRHHHRSELFRARHHRRGTAARRPGGQRPEQSRAARPKLSRWASAASRLRKIRSSRRAQAWNRESAVWWRASNEQETKLAQRRRSAMHRPNKIQSVRSRSTFHRPSTQQHQTTQSRCTTEACRI